MLVAKYGEVTVTRGDRHEYLGMVWDFSTAGQVRVSMDAYVNRMLEGCGVEGTAKTPARDDLFERSGELSDSEVCKKKQEWFHSYAAKCLYLAKRLRLECLPTVGYLATRVTCPVLSDVSKLERLLRYVRGTRGQGLVLRIGTGRVRVTAPIDAAFAVHSDRKSHTGGAVVIGDGAVVLAKSSKQKLVTKSSTESELVGAADFASTAYGVQAFLRGQGYKLPPIRIEQDNQSAMALMAKGRPTSDRSRHIDIKYFWLHDREAQKEIEIVYVPTAQMGRANCLTKPLQGSQFVSERTELLGE